MLDVLRRYSAGLQGHEKVNVELERHSAKSLPALPVTKKPA